MTKIQKTSRVAKWGKSLGFRIPREGVELLGLKEGESVDVAIGSESITIRRTKRRKKWTEEELLKGVTPKMCGPDLVPSRAGKEIL